MVSPGKAPRSSPGGGPRAVTGANWRPKDDRGAVRCGLYRSLAPVGPPFDASIPLWFWYGRGGGSMPVPLLLHGIPVTSSVWRPVLGPLSRLGRVLAPDLPLVTAPEAAPVDPEDWFHWLDVHVLGTVRDPVVLMVHDVGGPVGLYWAVRRPERLAGLVIMNTSVHPGATPWGSLLKVPGLVPALFALTLSPPLFGWQMHTLFGLSDEDRIAEYRAAYASRQCRRALARGRRLGTGVTGRGGEATPAVLSRASAVGFARPLDLPVEALRRMLPAGPASGPRGQASPGGPLPSTGSSGGSGAPRGGLRHGL